MMPEDAPSFGQELRDLLNRHSRENDSNTPDFVLAQYLLGCLDAWNKAVCARDAWYGVELRPGRSRFLNRARGE